MGGTDDAAGRGDTRNLWAVGMSANSTLTIERNQTVDALRGVAALAVVIGHLFAAAYRETGDSSVRAVSSAIAIDFVDWGRFGVTLFFLISGYVVPEFLVRGGAMRVFAVQRLTRIYPTFWLSVVVVVVTAFALHAKFPSLLVVLANLTLFPNLFRLEWLSGVYWTLNIEMLFYMLCIFGAATNALNNFKWVLVAIVVLVLLSIGPILLNHFIGGKVLPVQFTTYYISFLISGVLLRICKRTGNMSWNALLCACIPFYFVPVAAGVFFDVPGTFVAHSAAASLVGHALALIVFLSMIIFEIKGLGGGWLKIGESSYSLYLFHWPICALVIHLIGFGSILSTLVVVLISTILSLWVARFMFWFIERPSIRFGVHLRKKLI